MANNIPTHYLTRDYQFTGDALFPKGTLASKGHHGFTMRDDHGDPLCVFTGKTANLGDTIAGYDLGPDMKGMLRAIPSVLDCLRERSMHLGRAERCSDVAHNIVSEFVSKRRQ